MRYLATFFAIAILAAGCSSAQTTTNGALKLSSVVVTNEQDLAGIEFARTNLVMKIHNPANINEFIDGSGNKYVVSNFWTMTFSSDFADSLGGKPDETSYTSDYGVQVSETHGPYDWWQFGNNETGFYVNRRSGVGTYSNWRATTNQYVLDVSTTGIGKAFVTHTATTNLVTTLATTEQIAYRAPFTAYTDLTGSITLTNNLEAPISISGTGSISVAFSGLVVPYPVYFTAQGFSSIAFPAGSYLVGGGMWQTNRVNHFIVWKHSTNLFINPLLSTEIPE